MHLTLDQVSAFVRLPLRSLRHEYPNHIMHVLNDAQDAQTPRALHPVFYGCYDWHSAVHGYWLLARCARLYPALPQQDEIAQMFDDHFTAANMQQELAYFQTPGRVSFERPYGWAWIMALAQELETWQHPKAKAWLAMMEPLVAEIRSRVFGYFAKLGYAIRVGTHYNSAFALKLILDFARHRNDAELDSAIVTASCRYFMGDSNYSAHYEPGGDEFLSAALTEALLMADVLEADVFVDWFAQYLPKLADIDRLMNPAEVSDHSDPKIAHLNGLNLSRAWCMKRIARRLPENDPAAATLTAAARRHIEAGLPHVVSGEYAGEHWLATFAMLAMETVN
ncbi:DUF2891 domain-containing protein [Collimonas fungivorans]|uniref:DUF2891 family protein n=1 Tax=Collimonas fungivorans (strain Ter331) TaxID=1005048 RepID=G0AE77_COLFT|nr:DUF2891 domain-containing protein [Collimonas fungivorans]AEK64007.1 hypothetical protein CFU_4185 [Collimonas fungivorans Ter331]